MKSLKPGPYLVEAVIGEGAFRDRLLEVGFFPGLEVQILARLPLGGAFIIAFHETQFALRQEEAELLVLRPLS